MSISKVVLSSLAGITLLTATGCRNFPNYDDKSMLDGKKVSHHKTGLFYQHHVFIVQQPNGSSETYHSGGYIHTILGQSALLRNVEYYTPNPTNEQEADIIQKFNWISNPKKMIEAQETYDYYLREIKEKGF